LESEFYRDSAQQIRVCSEPKPLDCNLQVDSVATLGYSFLCVSEYTPEFLANVNSLTFAVCYRPSVCLSSITLVRPTQAVQIFGNISTAFGTSAILWHPWKILRRSSQGTPPPGELNTRGVAIAISDLSTAISRKRCEIGSKLVLITNRKSY